MRKVLWILLIFASYSYATPITYNEFLIYSETNAEREAKGLFPLELNLTLHQAAKKQAYRMAVGNKLSHSVGGDLSNRVEGYNFSFLGENIAWNFDANNVVSGWMNSSGHRANILNRDYHEIGIGVAWNSKGEMYSCQIFGTPRVTYKALLKSSLNILILILFGYIFLRKRKPKIYVNI